MKKHWTLISTSVFIALGASACGNTSGQAAIPGIRTYGTSANSGDFAQWVINTNVNPTTFSVNWTTTTASGAAAAVFTLGGTCGSADPTYGYYTCTIKSSASSSATISAPPVGAVFDILELPNTALLVHPETQNGRSQNSSNDEVHVGLAVAPCGSVAAGDYAYFHTASGSGGQPGFGVYRLTGANFNTIQHSDWGVGVNGTSYIGLASVNSSTNNTESNSTTCSNGVYTLTNTNTAAINAGASTTMRATASTSGAFFVDLGRGQGGLVSFPTSSAATIDDLASKTYLALSFSQSKTTLLKFNIGAKDSQNRVAATNFTAAGGGQAPSGFNVMALSNSLVSGKFTTFTDSTPSYSTAALSSAYSDASKIPGVFLTDEVATSPAGDQPSIFIAMKTSSGKIMVFGFSTQRGAGPTLTSNSSSFLAFSQ